jgi:hypothetical protein
VFCTQGGKELVAEGVAYCAYCGAKMPLAEARAPRDTPHHGLQEDGRRDPVVGGRAGLARLRDRGSGLDRRGLRSWASLAGKASVVTVALLVCLGLLWRWFQWDAYESGFQSVWVEAGIDQAQAMRIVDGVARALGIGLAGAAAILLAVWLGLRHALRSGCTDRT